MKKRNEITLYIGMLIVGIGFYFENWLGVLGLFPILFRAVDWLHGLFTHREMHLQ